MGDDLLLGVFDSIVHVNVDVVCRAPPVELEDHLCLAIGVHLLVDEAEG